MTPEELEARIRKLERDESWAGYFVTLLFICVILLMLILQIHDNEIKMLQDAVEERQ